MLIAVQLLVNTGLVLILSKIQRSNSDKQEYKWSYEQKRGSQSFIKHLGKFNLEWNFLSIILAL